MSASNERARSVWLLSFADVVTLLITFFIMMLAMHHTEITKIQSWTNNQIEHSYQVLKKSVTDERLDYFSVYRDERGIHVVVKSAGAFERGGFQVSPSLQRQLETLAILINELPLVRVHRTPEGDRMLREAASQGLSWRVEIIVEGHTDDDPVDPNSSLRSNWFLSTMRAQNVMQLLYRHSGLNNRLFSVAGYGEYRPLVANDTDENKAQNRRIDIVINASFSK
jgi:chemotaxis protein MotB